ncbi:MAG: cytochrome c biosis protein CcmG, thiol:disulfide interchange protein DsbE [Actinomycetota bacterium]|nr:cytochrome c biosis protein CcmG, thiol:disulfide interchange protein DsbE [Actinomycetota bacterium]
MSTRRAPRWLLAAAVVVVATVAVAGCGGGSTPSVASGGMAQAARPTGTSGSLDSLPPCPHLSHAKPVAGGLPDLTLPCLGRGPEVTLSDLRVRPLVVNVWAAWCTNCRREMPLYREAMRRAGDRLRFFGVHFKAPRGFGLRSAADFGVPFPSVQDTDGDRVFESLHVYAPPVTLFVAADGTVQGRKVGEIRSEAELAGLVHEYLGVSL